MTFSMPPIPHPTTTCTVNYLERRSSYLAKMPYQRNRPVKQKITDAAMQLSPATWFGPAILRAHDAHEYKKDRRRLDEQYQSYHRHGRRPRANNTITTAYEEGGYASVDATTTTTRTGTMTTSSTFTMGRRPSVVGARSEMSLPRARALEWAGSTSVFSPGLLQDWMILGGGGDSLDKESYYLPTLGPDPWALPPIERF